MLTTFASKIVTVFYFLTLLLLITSLSVSYTHLDVYKRQTQFCFVKWRGRSRQSSARARANSLTGLLAKRLSMLQFTTAACKLYTDKTLFLDFILCSEREFSWTTTQWVLPLVPTEIYKTAPIVPYATSRD